MTNRWPWVRYRFHTNANDYRPVTFPPPGPYWCSGYAGDDSFAIVVAYLPSRVQLETYWPDATEVQSGQQASISFSARFPRPDWWAGEDK